MSEQMRTAWDAAAAHNRIAPTLGAGIGRVREDLANARYYGPTRVDLPRKPGALSASELLRCFQHGDGGETRCINCDKPLCADCEYLLINGRVWCSRCGSEHQPSLRADLLSALLNVAKISVLFAVVYGIAVLAPMALDLRIFAATCVGLLGLWFLFDNDENRVKVQVVKPRRKRSRHKRTARAVIRAARATRSSTTRVARAMGTAVIS